MTDEEAKALLSSAASATLGTLTADGRPHLVPFCFVLEDNTVFSAIDHKPKSTMALRRLDNIRARPQATVLADHYENDWNQLWWVRGDGAARVIEDGPEREHAVDQLVAKYLQYQSTRPEGPVVAIDINQWRSWSAGRPAK